jgi:hypothetical protein
MTKLYILLYVLTVGNVGPDAATLLGPFNDWRVCEETARQITTGKAPAVGRCVEIRDEGIFK